MGVYETKLRTLYVMRILAENTDQDHILNATDICKLLEQQYQIHADRRTIYGEIEALRMFGVDIIQQKGKASGYYIGERSFEFPELKLLVDSVQSSKFITVWIKFIPRYITTRRFNFSMQSGRQKRN